MIELTKAQKKAIDLIGSKKYFGIGYPAIMVSSRTLKALIEKGVARRGIRTPSRIFIHPSHYSEYKQ